MKVYDWIVIGLLISIMVMLILRRVDKYTMAESEKFNMNSFLIGSFTHQSGSQQSMMINSVCDILLSQLGGDSTTALSTMNSLITTTNTAVPSLQAPLYATADEFNQVFTTAFSSSESAFGNDAPGKRNKMTLRTFASLPIGTVDFVKKIIPFTSSSDGKPSFTDEIVQASGKTVEEILKYGVKVIKAVYAAPSGPNGPVVSADALTLINSIFPSSIQKFTSGTEIMTESNNTTNPTPRILFFAKAYIIGFAYIVWLAENKWRLDPTWSAGITLPSNVMNSPPPAPPATRVT